MGYLIDCMSHGGGTVVIKIDPMLERIFPQTLWRELSDWSIVTDDSISYSSQGINFEWDQNIMMWKVLSDALNLPTHQEGILGNETSKKTFSDVSYHIAQQIWKIINKTHAQQFVIEVWGCPDDKESSSIPLAIRHLKQIYSAYISIIIVTKYDTAQGRNGIEFKSRRPVRAIETTMSRYWDIPLQACLVRRDCVPENITNQELMEGTRKIAFKTGISNERILYLPNVQSINSIHPYSEIILSL